MPCNSLLLKGILCYLHNLIFWLYTKIVSKNYNCQHAAIGFFVSVPFFTCSSYTSQNVYAMVLLLWMAPEMCHLVRECTKHLPYFFFSSLFTSVKDKTQSRFLPFFFFPPSQTIIYILNKSVMPKFCPKVKCLFYLLVFVFFPAFLSIGRLYWWSISHMSFKWDYHI